MREKRSFWRAFVDFFVLFGGVSTASNLSRTRKTPIVGRGMFLFRKGQSDRFKPSANASPNESKS